MQKIVKIEVSADEATQVQNALDAYILEMEHASERMKKDQEEIDRLKEETKAIAVETGVLLAELKEAA
ncbi:MAG: hypothetical protein DMF74_06030 [Acidobacteria bacterium]|nr:MAG: hypothetical protein DMF74_06030 [Acidobacteriota bacterium]